MKRLQSATDEATVTEQARAYLAGTVVYDERTLIADLLELVEKYGYELLQHKEEFKLLERQLQEQGDIIYQLSDDLGSV